MNFKVRCLISFSGITKGKIYEIQSGYFCFDDGSKAGPYKNLKELNQHLGARFELVTDKPRICEILGNGKPLEVGEDFSFGNNHNLSIEQYCGSDSYSIFDNQGLEVSGRLIVGIINHPEKIIRQPQFSEDEKALMRLLVSIGTPFIARDKDYNEIKSSSIPQIHHYNPNIWIVERTAKVRGIPKEIFSQITWENSPFDAKGYLEGLK